MNDLKVYIPIRFKEQLERRFSYENRTQKQEFIHRISVPCPLCEGFRKCDYCPFTDWAKRAGIYIDICYGKTTIRLGPCWAKTWIVMVLEGKNPYFQLTFENVSWPVQVNEQVKDQFNRLRKAAEGNIVWI